jgi:hypothetical protein
VSFGIEMSFEKGIITVNQKIGLQRGEGLLHHIIIFIGVRQTSFETGCRSSTDNPASIEESASICCSNKLADFLNRGNP